MHVYIPNSFDLLLTTQLAKSCLGRSHHSWKCDGGATLRALPQGHEGGVEGSFVGGVHQVTETQHRHGDADSRTVDGSQQRLGKLNESGHEFSAGKNMKEKFVTYTQSESLVRYKHS